MTTFTDSFTGTDGSAPSATNWSTSLTTGSTATIQSNALRLSTGSSGAYGDVARMISKLPLAADVDLTLDVTPGSATAEAYFDIMLRAPGADFALGQAGYKFEVTNSGWATIQKVAAYSGTTLGTGAQVSGWAAGVQAHLEAKIVGSTLQFWAWTGATKPSTPTVQVADSSITAAGYTGFYLNGGSAASATTWTADNFSATDALGGTPALTASASLSGSGGLAAITTGGPAPALTATAALSGGGGLSTPGGTGTTGSTQGTTYTASVAVISNPERGPFYYTETHYQSSTGSGHVPLDGTAVAAAVASGQTQIFRYCYLEQYNAAGSTIDSTYLSKLATDLATARANGAKLILRFAYTSVDNETYPYGNPDPGPTTSVGHIQQLAPTLNAYADVIEIVEAGFIGLWGEWYYTANYSQTNPSATLSAQNWIDRKAILSALLSNLDPRIFICVRYAGVKPNYFGQTTIPADSTQAGYWRRMGYHDDALGASSDDWGTFTTFPWSGWSNVEANAKAFVQGDVATYPLPWGGEIASGNFTYAGFKTEMSTYRANFWNPSDFGGSQAGQGWTAANQTEIQQSLGYRLRLVSATLPASGSSGASAAVTLVVANDGWSTVLRNRPVIVDFVNGSTVVSSTLTADPRTWQPGAQATVSGTVTLPSTAGSWTMHLRLPDPSANLAANPAYAIRLAHSTGWDSSTGRNALNASVTVTAASGSGGMTPGLTANGSLSGSGSLTATRGTALQANGTLSGSGSLTATRGTALQANGTLSGSGSLTATRGTALQANGSLSGSGSLTATRGTALQANGTLSGSGSLVASLATTLRPHAQLTGSGVVLAMIDSYLEVSDGQQWIAVLPQASNGVAWAAAGVHGS